MPRHVTLQNRVKRELKRLRRRRKLPTIFMAIHDSEGCGQPIGYEGAGVTVIRAAGEALEGLKARAARQIPSRFIRTLYAPFPGTVEPFPIATPAPAPAMPTFDRSNPEAWRGWRAFAEEGLKP